MPHTCSPERAADVRVTEVCVGLPPGLSDNREAQLGAQPRGTAARWAPALGKGMGTAALGSPALCQPWRTPCPVGRSSVPSLISPGHRSEVKHSCPTLHLVGSSLCMLPFGFVPFPAFLAKIFPLTVFLLETASSRQGCSATAQRADVWLFKTWSWNVSQALVLFQAELELRAHSGMHPAQPGGSAALQPLCSIQGIRGPNQ